MSTLRLSALARLTRITHPAAHDYALDLVAWVCEGGRPPLPPRT
jgi:hypothetical protein